MEWEICDPNNPDSLLEPLPAQMDFAASDSFATGFFGGWGASKSIAGGLFCALSSQLNPPGNAGVVILPSYPMIEQWLTETIQPMLHRVIVEHRVKARTFILKGGRRLVYMSGHKPTSIQAINASWVYLDEAHLMGEGVWHHAVARARKKNANLRIGLTSLPKIGWLSELFSGKSNALYRAMHARTADNPHVDPGYVKTLKASCPRRLWPAYLEGQFCATGGGVYPEFSRETHVIDWPQTASGLHAIGIRNPEIGIGADPSMRRPHVLWVQKLPIGTRMPGGWVTTAEVCVVVDEIYPGGEFLSWTIERLCNAILERSRETGWLPDHVVTDPAGLARGVNATRSGGTINTSTITQLEQFTGLPIAYRTGELVRLGVQHVQLMLAPSVGHPRLFVARHLAERGLQAASSVIDKYQLRPDRQESRGIVRALEGYSYPEDSRGRLVDEPFHDDIASHACDALRYFVRYHYPVERLGVMQYAV